MDFEDATGQWQDDWNCRYRSFALLPCPPLLCGRRRTASDPPSWGHSDRTTCCGHDQSAAASGGHSGAQSHRIWTTCRHFATGSTGGAGTSGALVGRAVGRWVRFGGILWVVGGFVVVTTEGFGVVGCLLGALEGVPVDADLHEKELACKKTAESNLRSPTSVMAMVKTFRPR